LFFFFKFCRQFRHASSKTFVQPWPRWSLVDWLVAKQEERNSAFYMEVGRSQANTGLTACQNAGRCTNDVIPFLKLSSDFCGSYACAEQHSRMYSLQKRSRRPLRKLRMRRTAQQNVFPAETLQATSAEVTHAQNIIAECIPCRSAPGNLCGSYACAEQHSRMYSLQKRSRRPLRKLRMRRTA